VDVLTRRKYFVLVDQGWSEWDLEAHGGVWARARIKVCTENHGGERRVLRVKCALRTSRPARGVLGAAVLMAGIGWQIGLSALVLAGLVVGVGTGVGLLREALGLGRTLYDTLHGVARRARMHYAPPLGGRGAPVSEVSGVTRRPSGQDIPLVSP
jgi:hypothetical protein